MRADIAVRIAAEPFLNQPEPRPHGGGEGAAHMCRAPTGRRAHRHTRQWNLWRRDALNRLPTHIMRDGDGSLRRPTSLLLALFDFSFACCLGFSQLADEPNDQTKEHHRHAQEDADVHANRLQSGKRARSRLARAAIHRVRGSSVGASVQACGSACSATEALAESSINWRSTKSVITRPTSESLSVVKTPLPTPGFSSSSSHFGSPRSSVEPSVVTAVSSDVAICA